MMNCFLVNYKTNSEITGYLTGTINNDIRVENYYLYRNKSNKPDKASFKPVKDKKVIGYFHSHISGNINISFQDKIILLLMTYILKQPLMIIYTFRNYIFLARAYTINKLKVIKQDLN